MTPSDEERAAELLGEWAQDRGAGEAADEEWLRQHPSEADVLRAGIDVIRQIDGVLVPDLDESGSGAPESILARLRVGGAFDPQPVLLAEDGQESPPVVVPRAGAEGRYQIMGEIARGGIGVVLRGHDVDIGRDVAVKVLREDYASRAEFVQRFVEEAQIGGQLQHPGIVPVYEVGLGKDRRPYFTMKLIKGRTLAALLFERKTSREEVSRFLSIFESVCQTVAYAHARGVIHRDLKPANVMVGAFGEVMVVDWGLAKVLRQGGVADERRAHALRADLSVIATVRSRDDGSASVVGSVMGTPAYMCPEQARGAVEEIDERSDVFALGAILCEILTGQPPYTGTADEVYGAAATARQEGLRERLAASGADGPLVALAEACLAPAPAARPRDAAAVARSLAAYLASIDEKRRAAEAEAARATLRAAVERARRKFAMALAAAVVTLVALGAGAFYWVGAERRDRADAASRGVTTALDEATALRARASAAATDLGIWSEAVSAARRARSIADWPDADDATRERATRALEDLEREARAAQDAVREDTTNRRLVEHLEEVRAAAAEAWSHAHRHDRYAAVLAEHGLDPERAADLDGLGLRVRTSPVRQPIVVALDEWRRMKVSVGRSTARLDALLAAADPDPWRGRLRTAETLDELHRLAQEVDVGNLPVESVLALVTRLGRQGDAPGAAALAKRAQARHPADYWANFAAARWARECKPPRLNAAIRFYTAAVALRPLSAAAHGNLGNALKDNGDVDGAIAEVREAIRLRPDVAEFHNNLAVALRQRGDTDGAAAEFREAIRLQPDYMAARVNLSDMLREVGDLEGAIVAARDAIRLQPGLATAHDSLGVALKEQGDLDGAIASAREAVRLEPNDASFHTNLGAALARRGDFDDAIIAHGEALRLAPEFSAAHNNLGNVLRMKGDLPGAIARYREALRLQPGQFSIHANLGDTLVKHGKAAEAIPEYRKAIQLRADLPQLHCNLAQALALEGSLDEAVAAYREAIRLQPDHVQSLSNLGALLVRRGEHAAAIVALRAAVRVDPSYTLARLNLGNVLCAEGELDGALVEYHAAVRLEPDLPATVRLGKTLARALREAGRDLEAELIDPPAERAGAK